MTIIFLCRLFYPHIGGVEKHVFEISKRLRRQGHKIIIIAEKDTTSSVGSLPKSIQKELRFFSIHYIFVKDTKWLKKFIIWKWLWKHKKLLSKADIIHCHDVFFWYLPFRFLYSRKPVYTTFHGYEQYPIKSRAIFIRKISEKLSNGNICIGDFIPKWYGTKPTLISYGGVDSSKLKNQNAKLKIKKSAVFIGRLDQQTGIKTYNQAYAILKEKYPSFQFTVVGKGPYEKDLEKGIHVVKAQVGGERFFSRSHFAFVSRYLSMLEAMASKRLVFALYDNPVKEDYLRMTPFSQYIIISHTGKDLARKVQYFLDNPQKEKRITNKAFQWVKTNTWDGVVSQYKTLWGYN